MATASIAVGASTGGGAPEYVAAALDILDELGIQTICDALAAIHKRWHELGRREWRAY